MMWENVGRTSPLLNNGQFPHATRKQEFRGGICTMTLTLDDGRSFDYQSCTDEADPTRMRSGQNTDSCFPAIGTFNPTLGSSGRSRRGSPGNPTANIHVDTALYYPMER